MPATPITRHRVPALVGIVLALMAAAAAPVADTGSAPAAADLAQTHARSQTHA